MLIHVVVGLLLVACSEPGVRGQVDPEDPGERTTTDTVAWPGAEVCLPTDLQRLRQCEGRGAAFIGNRAYDTIGDALLEAARGDQVWVCPGEWEVRAEIRDTTLGLLALDPTPGATVLRGNGRHRLLEVWDSTLTLDGFTVREGRARDGADYGDGYGGAVFAADSSLDVRCSQFVDNVADAEGGAVYALFTSVDVRNASFSNNEARGGRGAAVHATNSPADHYSDSVNWFRDPPQNTSSAVTLVSVAVFDHATPYAVYIDNWHRVGRKPLDFAARNCVFEANNHALHLGGGHSLVEGSRFYDNVAHDGAPGGAVSLLVLQSSQFIDNELHGNRAGVGGAIHFDFSGVWVINDGDVEIIIRGGEMSDNHADRYGGAISVDYINEEWRPSMLLEDVTLHRNTTGSRGAAVSLGQSNVDYPTTQPIDATLRVDRCDFGAEGNDNSPRDLQWHSHIVDEVAATDQLELRAFQP